MSGGLERARARKVRACVHALNNFHIFFSTCIVSPYIGKTRSVEKSWRRKQETPKNGQMATVWVKMSERVKRKRSQKLLVRAHYARTSKNFFCTCQRGLGGMSSPIIWKIRKKFFKQNWAIKVERGPKEGERVRLDHFHERVDESRRSHGDFELSGAILSFFLSEIWPF